jgi:hypothetical protein
MPNSWAPPPSGANLKIWEPMDSDPNGSDLQKQIRILYHRLKQNEIDQQFIIDARFYYLTGRNRPNMK